MLTICGQTGVLALLIHQDVPKTRPPTSNPRPPKTPPDRRERIEPPVFFLADWREFFDLSFRDMGNLTGIDPGQLTRLEERAAGKDVKNKTNGVGYGVLEAYRDAFGFQTIEPLRRRPSDPPTQVELFMEGPSEWRENTIRWRPPVPPKEPPKK